MPLSHIALQWCASFRLKLRFEPVSYCFSFSGVSLVLLSKLVFTFIAFMCVYVCRFCKSLSFYLTPFLLLHLDFYEVVYNYRFVQIFYVFFQLFWTLLHWGSLILTFPVSYCITFFCYILLDYDVAILNSALSDFRTIRISSIHTNRPSHWWFSVFTIVAGCGVSVDY